MITSRSFRPTLFKTGIFSSIGLAVLALTSVAQAQYSTNFDGLNATLPLSTQDGWGTNDVYDGSSYNPTGTAAMPAPGGYFDSQIRYIGNSDGLTTQPTYRTSSTDQQAFVGGAANVGGGELPGTSTVYTSHPTNLSPTSNVSFNTDYVVTPPATNANGAATDAHDGFGWTFQNNAGGNLFAIVFSTPSNGSTAADNTTYRIGNGVAATAVSSFTLGSRYHLTVNVSVNAAGNGGTFSAFYIPQNLTGGNNGTAVTIANSIAYTGTIADIAATWNLTNSTTVNANGTQAAGSTNNVAYTAGGSNVMLFDNLSIVPEPSTYVLLGLGVVALGATLRSRRSQTA